MTQIRVPFNRPSIVGQELHNIQEAVQNNWNLSGDGPFSKKVQAYLEQEVGVLKALLTPSCTAALEMAAILLDIQPGDEVIMPAFTFVSTPNAFVLRGAKPVFCDIRPDTLNLDERILPNLITERTKAIVPVHYAGIACEMDTIMAIANRHGIAVVEDNAHGLFGTYKGRQLGTFGVLNSQSFHETKNFQCGEGGALLITAEAYIERAEIIREKGTNRSRFFRGQVDKYTWVDMGSSFLLSDLSAAFLWAQFEKRDAVQAARKRIWDTYLNTLGDWAAHHNVQIPTIPDDAEPAYHLFYLVFPTPIVQADFIAYMRARGINTVFHYQPLHLSPMGERYGGKIGDCPVTERVSSSLVRLPYFTLMTEDDQQAVIDAVLNYTVKP